MAWTLNAWHGFNFRATNAFVTDSSDCVFVNIGSNSSAYTVEGNSRTFQTMNDETVNGDTVGFGVYQNYLAQSRDRQAGNDPKLAGCIYIGNDAGADQLDIRFTLPSAGTYEISLAMGEPDGPHGHYWQIYDTTSLLETNDYMASTALFRDATGAAHTSAANWISNQTPKQYVFSTTEFRFRWGSATGGNGTTSALSHLSIRQLGSTRSLLTKTIP